jgi:hypothetical protein
VLPRKTKEKIRYDLYNSIYRSGEIVPVDKGGEPTWFQEIHRSLADIHDEKRRLRNLLSDEEGKT